MTDLRRGMSLAALLTLAPALHAAPTGLDSRVTIEVRQAPMATFLDTVSAQAKVNFILTEGFEKKRVTAFLHDVTIKEALDVLGQTNGVGYRQVGRSNTYIIAAKDSPQLRQPEIAGGGSDLDQRVTIRLKNAPLDQFFESISAQTHLNFALDEGLEGRKVTAFLQNVTVREALEVMLTIKGLSCRKLDDNKTYGIGKKR
ncbi:MAG: hypothetical protein HY077_15175 [Elusimicrobia bacterium]|nr:hypothetical protein [Elusimicrobiota bacterium]